MGGPGVGHKSWRAQEARRINIRKARAARRREPLPWRSGLESRVIEQLVWQWWTLKKEASGEHAGRDEPRMALASDARPVDVASHARVAPVGGRRFARPSGDFGRRGKAFGAQGGWMIPAPWQPANLSSTAGTSKAGATGSGSDLSQGSNRSTGAMESRQTLSVRQAGLNPFLCQGLSQSTGAMESRQTVKPVPAYKLARMLGVSHTWVNKLAKRFEADPERARRRNGAFAPATWATLERAREETRWQREHGRLRGPMPRRTRPRRVAN